MIQSFCNFFVFPIIARHLLSSELQTEFEGNEVLALAAYNAGRGNVYEWMEKYHWDINFKDYTKIPFPETREYVKRVLENKKHYNKLYK